MILQIIIVLGRQGINSFVHDPNKIIIITYFFPLRAFICLITQKLKIAIEIDIHIHKINAKLHIFLL